MELKFKYLTMKKELREKVWRKFNERCAYCGNKIEYKAMQVDHIEPKYLGGANEIENYYPACRQCNFYKGTFSIDAFRENLKTMHERVLKIFLVKIAIKYGILTFKKPFDGIFYFEKQK